MFFATHCNCSNEPDVVAAVEEEQLVDALQQSLFTNPNTLQLELNGKANEDMDDDQKSQRSQRSFVSRTSEAEVLTWQVDLDDFISGSDGSGVLKSLGAEFIRHKDMLVVSQVGEGAFATFNPGQAVRAILPGTVIVQVNGNSGTPEELLAEIDRCSKLHLSLFRLRTYDVHVCKDGSLGLDCYRRTGVVRSVLSGGVIDKYNQSCEPGREVLPGDCVYALNTNVLEPLAFFEKLQEFEGPLLITLHRP